MKIGMQGAGDGGRDQSFLVEGFEGFFENGFTGTGFAQYLLKI